MSHTPDTGDTRDTGETELPPAGSPQLARSRQAELRVFVNMLHPQITEVVGVGDDGIRLAREGIDAVVGRCCNGDDAATAGYAVAQALDVMHDMDVGHGDVSADHIGATDDGKVTLHIDQHTAVSLAAMSPDQRAQAVDRDLRQLLAVLSVLPVADDHPLRAVLDEAATRTPPTAEHLALLFAAAGASATLPPSPQARPPDHEQQAETQPDPPAELLDGPAEQSHDSADRRTRARVVCLGIALGALGLLALARWAPVTSAQPCPPAPHETGSAMDLVLRAEPACPTFATFDGATATLVVAGEHRAQVGSPGDIALVVDIECDGRDELVLWRPSTHEGFVFRPPFASQTASVHFLAIDEEQAGRSQCS